MIFPEELLLSHTGVAKCPLMDRCNSRGRLNESSLHCEKTFLLLHTLCNCDSSVTYVATAESMTTQQYSHSYSTTVKTTQFTG